MSDRELTTKIGDSTSISDRSFESLNISDRTKNAVKKLGFSTMTEIQAKSIPLIMVSTFSLKSDKDVIGAAKTGSGKTLSFLIPSFDLLHRDNFKQKYGTGVLIISPTRELALQIFGVAKEIGKEHPSRNIGIVMGGCNRAKEAKMLSKNVSLLVATPGRLLDHLKNTKKFVLKKLKLLVIDEADRILDNGFEQEMNRILDLLPESYF
ncbi:ATP-dependent RNA helicase [Bonamia ostreae]|uniref:ATP-dependent RNA helicase n=1 Tax=Bonamia ostreae TaxID=126728 RepID=A0ABV2ALR1_9EUKA